MSFPLNGCGNDKLQLAETYRASWCIWKWQTSPCSCSICRLSRHRIHIGLIIERCAFPYKSTSVFNRTAVLLCRCGELTQNDNKLHNKTCGLGSPIRQTPRKLKTSNLHRVVFLIIIAYFVFLILTFSYVKARFHIDASMQWPNTCIFNSWFFTLIMWKIMKWKRVYSLHLCLKLTEYIFELYGCHKTKGNLESVFGSVWKLLDRYEMDKVQWTVVMRLNWSHQKNAGKMCFVNWNSS